MDIPLIVRVVLLDDVVSKRPKVQKYHFYFLDKRQLQIELLFNNFINVLDCARHLALTLR